MADLQILIITGVITVAAMLAIWPLSLKLQDVSIVDIYWGPGFAVIAWTVYAFGDTHPERSLILACLVTVWSLRLGLLMLRRHVTKTEEDPRYAAMRERAGPSFAYSSFASVFLLQAVLMWLISLPIQIGQLGPNQAINIYSMVPGIALFLAGLAIETVSDEQLARFKSDPDNRGQVFTEGLWAWSRHPNYFGEILVWWGLFVCALSNSQAVWTILAPALLTYLIVRVSGVTMLEQTLMKSKPDYTAYRTRTSSLIPRPPKNNND